MWYKKQSINCILVILVDIFFPFSSGLLCDFRLCCLLPSDANAHMPHMVEEWEDVPYWHPTLHESFQHGKVSILFCVMIC